VYKQILIHAKLHIGKRGKKSEVTGRCPVKRRRAAMDCSAIEEEEEEEIIIPPAQAQNMPRPPEKVEPCVGLCTYVLLLSHLHVGVEISFLDVTSDSRIQFALSILHVCLP